MPNKRGQGPTLFIHQPFSRTPANNMQDIYSNKKEKQQELVEGKKRKKAKPLEDEVLEPIEVTIDKEEQEKQRTMFKKVKAFKEMNLNERLEYLINFPKVLPPVPCVFYTNDHNYQGYLTEYQDDQVTIQFHDQTAKTISVHDLKDIIMIGIKK